ncbi:putative copper resistance protein D [Pseudonocardia ammonioxydans]|uniref:Putative copper resistance protein D n=1 Tax=Pseudonocardia ammonioxydans TaxID=260086 RepID=A0A1I5HBU1_PSUAM|nr:cytochrome c oxidase assembly protein [Pseudonocardia ammonioxydans]SFO45281.1 putative copper resistance protein D [Pseudonocardia ammonioxydans]
MTTACEAAPTPRRSGWSWLGWWLPVAAVTGLAVGVAGPDLAVLFGYRSLGPVAAVAHPFARTLAIGAGTVAVAGLLVAVVYVPGAPRGALSPVGYGALAVVRRACPVLCAAALVVALLTVSETIGIRPAALVVDPPTLLVAMATVEPAAGWVITAVIALLVGGLASMVLTWRGASGLLMLLVAGFAVPPATSVANSERAHDWYGDALVLHTVAGVLWLASTIAVTTLWRRSLVDRAVLGRHSRIALGCSVVLLLSGLVPTALDVGVDGLASGYGLLVVASAALLVAGLVAVRRLWRPRRAPRLWAAELTILMAAAAAGTAMSRLVPPGAAETTPYRESERLVYLLGYDLPARMGLVELAGWWRIDLLFAPAALVAAAAYLHAVRKLRRRGGTWPVSRTATWTAGCLTVLVATSSGIGAYATAVFGVHLLGHALLATVAPLLLILGHPLTLVRCVGSTRTVERVAALLDAAPMRALHRPAVAWCVATVAVFGVYATGLFDAVVLEHWSHPAMDALALGSGVVLFRAVLGSREPQPPPFVRLGLLFAVMMLHAAFGIWLLVQAEPLAGWFYAAVAMPFVPDLLADQRQGAVVAWVVSDLAMVAAALSVARSWMVHDRASSAAQQEASAAARPAPLSS